MATVEKHFLSNFCQKKLFQINLFLSCKAVLISVKNSVVRKGLTSEKIQIAFFNLF